MGAFMETLDGGLFGPDQPCFGCSPQHPIGFRLSFVRDGEEVVTRFMPKDCYQGPPGVMHGGLVSTLVDEIGAWAIIALMGKFAFTTSLELRFKRPIRIGIEVVGRGRISAPGRRVVGTSVTLWQEDQIAVESTLRFVMLDKRGAEKFLGIELPQAWQRFGR